MKIQKTYRRVSKPNRTGVINVKEIYRMYSEIERIERDLQKMKRKLRLYSQGSDKKELSDTIKELLEAAQSKTSRRSRIFSDEKVSDQQLSTAAEEAAELLDKRYGDPEEVSKEIELYKNIAKGNEVQIKNEDPYENVKYETQLVDSPNTGGNNIDKKSRLYRRIFSKNQGLYITVDVSPDTLKNFYSIYESESKKRSGLMTTLSNVFAGIGIGSGTLILLIIVAKILGLTAIAAFLSSKGWIIAVIGLLAVLLAVIFYKRSEALKEARVKFKEYVEHLSALMSIMKERNIEDEDIRNYLKAKITEIGFNIAQGRFLYVSKQAGEIVSELYKKLSEKYNIKRVYLNVGNSIRLVYAQV